MTHICVSKLTIIDSDNGLSPGRRQAIIWTNARILLIGALGTNVSEILIKICTFSLKKMLLKMSSGKRRPSCVKPLRSEQFWWTYHVNIFAFNIFPFTIISQERCHQQLSYFLMEDVQGPDYPTFFNAMASDHLVTQGGLLTKTVWLLSQYG